MKIIYAVMECHSDYDDAWATPIYSTFDKAKATSKVEEMEQRYKDMIAAFTANQQYIIEWDKLNPRPTMITPKLQTLPTWNNKWSDEKKDEYRAIRKNNEAKNVEALKPLSEWTQARFKALKDHQSTFSEKIKEDLNNMNQKAYWQIEEVPFEE